MRGRIVILNGMEFPDYTITKKGTLYSKKINNPRHIVIPTFNNRRHRIVSIYGTIGDNTKKCTTSIHRILACTYIKKTEDDIKFNRNIVHFRDWNSSNIALSNLVWVNKFELILLQKIKEREETFKHSSTFVLEYREKFPDIYEDDDIINFYKSFKASLR